MSWADGLGERFFADRPVDAVAWLVENLPEHVHIQSWASLLDLAKSRALDSLLDRSGDPEAGDFRLAVSMLVAALDLRRVPAFLGIDRLHIYARMQERVRPPAGPLIAELEPDALIRRILTLSPQSALMGEEPDRETMRVINSLSLELRWAADRATDPDLVRQARVVLGEGR